MRKFPLLVYTARPCKAFLDPYGRRQVSLPNPGRLFWQLARDGLDFHGALHHPWLLLVPTSLDEELPLASQCGSCFLLEIVGGDHWHFRCPNRPNTPQPNHPTTGLWHFGLKFGVMIPGPLRFSGPAATGVIWTLRAQTGERVQNELPAPGPGGPR